MDRERPFEAALMEAKFFMDVDKLASGAVDDAESKHGGDAVSGECDSDDEDEETETSVRDEDVDGEDGIRENCESGLGSTLETGGLRAKGDPKFRADAGSSGSRGESGLVSRTRDETAVSPFIFTGLDEVVVGNKAPASVKSDGSESEGWESCALAKRKRKKKRKNAKKKGVEANAENATSNFLLEDEPLVDSTAKRTEAGVSSQRSSDAWKKETVVEISAPLKSKIDSDGKPTKKRTKRSQSESESLSESCEPSKNSQDTPSSVESGSGIKSILKNRTRSVSGESFSSDVFDSSLGERRFGDLSGSLTSVTQSLESLSLDSIPAASSFAEGLDVSLCGLWSAGSRKSVHFSSFVDRKRFRSGAPPQNVGKGRRNSGCKSGKQKVKNELGKKRHLSESDAALVGFGRKFDAKDIEESGASTSASNGASSAELGSASSEEVFEMEDVHDNNDLAESACVEEINSRSLLTVLEEEEARSTPPKNGQGDSQKPKQKKKKSKSKRGKRNDLYERIAGNGGGEDDDDTDVCSEGWSMVTNPKLGKKKKNVLKTLSDLTLSDADEGDVVTPSPESSLNGASSINNNHGNIHNNNLVDESGFTLPTRESGAVRGDPSYHPSEGSQKNKCAISFEEFLHFSDSC